MRNNYDWHIKFILELVKLVEPSLYVEIGLYKCKLFNKASKKSAKSIGVDIEKWTEKYFRKTKTSKFLNMSSNEFILYAKENHLEIDFLFIDADHSKESVLSDFKGMFEYVKNNGLILIHDSYPANIRDTEPGYCNDGYLAIEILSKDTTNYEMITIPKAPGLTICRKRDKHLHWL